jgi:Ras GTPase-activating-like protein IQGAP2/3
MLILDSFLRNSLPYDEVKIEALTVCKSLQLKGTITPTDGYQAILNSIANDIRTKNRKQIQREKELKSMQNALSHLEDKKTSLEEQIQMYNAHNAQSISNMQDKGKRSSVIPLGKQFWHRRSLRADGKMPEYGSWVYESKLLYSRGLLLSIDQYSPTQFDKMEVVFSSNEAGTFNIDITILPPGHSKKTVGKATVTMQEVRVFLSQAAVLALRPVQADSFLLIPKPSS